MSSLQSYKGSVRKLVLGIDVGTTFSGVAYTILDPGEIPKILGVTRFPGQECSAGDSKIPSILYYYPDGKIHSVGAEAAVPGIELEAEDEGLVFVQWFKLHLRPASMDSGDLQRADLPPLPQGKSAVAVFADFLAYLFTCAKRYITETHANGESLWTSLENRIEFVLSHPNGWEGLQQGKMRQAATMAGLVPNTPAGQARVHFVTEGEASLNFCIQNGLANETMKDGHCVMIIDAGGGTVDISSYVFLSVAPIAVEEVTSADCILQGSTQVNVRAKHHLQELLKASAYGNEEDIKTMLDYFDQSTKPVFKDEKDSSYIKFGSMSCNDPNAKIRRGTLTLSGSEMASFFQPCLNSIVKTAQKQRKNASRPLGTAFLVGGFAASPWLYASLKRTLGNLGLNLFRPDSHTNKAVANGAVCYFLEHFVSARVMKMTYGTQACVDYDRNDAEHIARRGSCLVRPSGRTVLPRGFSSILKKNTRVREQEEISNPYQIETRNVRTLDSIVTEICCYRGPDKDPHWTDIDPEFYTPLCTIYANTSDVARVPRIGPQGLYYVQDFDIVLLCGLTELKAQISWMENGVEKRGPAKIVYDDDLEILT